MNKNILIGAIVVLLAGGGYYQFSVKPAQEAAAAAAAAAEAEAKAAEEAAAKAAEEAAAAAKMAEEEAAAAAAALEAVKTEAMSVLSATPFDAAKVSALIDASTLIDDATKATLKAGLTAAATNPALVDGAIAAVKTALGL